MKTLCLFYVLFLVACSRAFRDFPTEEQVRSQLKQGMTPEQVVALFGTPGGGTAEGYRDARVFTYLCPVGRRTREVEGYSGFKAIFRNDRLIDWQPITSNPSFDPDMHTREHLFPVFLVWGLIFGGAFIYGLAKSFRRGASEYKKIMDIYASRQIPTRKLPPDFRFITNDTILHEVVERVGPWTGMWKLPVDEDTSAGYAALESESGTALIVAYEYELPYHAAVILLPEYPFGPDDRIRAVYYRPPQRDEE